MPDEREMPKYKCHKVVHALKIASLDANPNTGDTGGALLFPVDEGYAPFPVSKEYIEKHSPQKGGYYVVYEDGYKSYSPAKAFEEGYTKMD